MLAACGGAAPPPRAASRSASAGGEARPQPPMHLLAQETARGPLARIDLELREDGSVLWHGELTARFANGRLYAPDGQEIPLADVMLGPRRRRRRARIVEETAVAYDNGERLYFDEQGRVVQARPRRPLRWLPVQLTGLRPDAVRPAVTLLLFALVKADAAARAPRR